MQKRFLLSVRCLLDRGPRVYRDCLLAGVSLSWPTISKKAYRSEPFQRHIPYLLVATWATDFVTDPHDRLPKPPTHVLSRRRLYDQQDWQGGVKLWR